MAILQLAQGLPCGRFTVKLATSDEEKAAVFRLRYLVFNEELGEGIAENEKTGLDRDAFDDFCDHLMLISDDGQVVGTYRLLCGPQRPPQGFYSETEFDLRALNLDWDHTVELGRGCVAADFRRQTTLMTLFWGLHRYMLSRGARHLIGCGSFAPMTHDDAEATFDALKQTGKVDLASGAKPLPANDFLGDAAKGKADIPQLVSLYLEFGAKILGRPAYDPIFRCHDTLLVFDMDHLSDWGTELLRRFDRRLLAASGEQD